MLHLFRTLASIGPKDQSVFGYVSLDILGCFILKNGEKNCAVWRRFASRQIGRRRGERRREICRIRWYRFYRFLLSRPPAIRVGLREGVRQYSSRYNAGAAGKGEERERLRVGRVDLRIIWTGTASGAGRLGGAYRGPAPWEGRRLLRMARTLDGGVLYLDLRTFLVPAFRSRFLLGRFFFQLISSSNSLRRLFSMDFVFSSWSGTIWLLPLRKKQIFRSSSCHISTVVIRYFVNLMLND